MPVQTIRYYMPDAGALLSYSDGGRPLRLSEAEVRELVRANTFGLPVGFFVEMIRSESNFAWNEVDTDYDSDGNAREGKDTYGLCQLRKTEFAGALSAGSLSDAAALAPEENISAFARVMARYADAIDALSPGAPTFDRLCYLAWAHNYGIGTITTSITTYGLDWQATKARSQSEHFYSRLVPYAERAASAGMADPGEGSGYDSTLIRLAGLLLVGWLGWVHFVRG